MLSESTDQNTEINVTTNEGKSLPPSSAALSKDDTPSPSRDTADGRRSANNADPRTTPSKSGELPDISSET